jgi:hypothetical protein
LSELVKPLALAPPAQDTTSHHDVLLLTHIMICSKVHRLPPVRNSDFCVIQTQEDCDVSIGVTGGGTFGVTGVTVGVTGVTIGVTGVTIGVTGVTNGVPGVTNGVPVVPIGVTCVTVGVTQTDSFSEHGDFHFT